MVVAIPVLLLLLLLVVVVVAAVILVAVNVKAECPPRLGVFVVVRFAAVGEHGVVWVAVEQAIAAEAASTIGIRRQPPPMRLGQGTQYGRGGLELYLSIEGGHPPVAVVVITSSDPHKRSRS